MRHEISIEQYTVHVAECDCGWHSDEQSRPEAEALGREHIETHTEKPDWISQAQWKKLIERGEIIPADTLHHRPRRLVIDLDD